MRVIERLLTAAEVAEIVGFTADTIVDWAEAGKIPAFKLGRQWRFRESEILAWIEEHRVGPGAGGSLLPTPTADPTRGVALQALPTPLGGGTHAR
jgi:excisionase family DNA binding protein